MVKHISDAEFEELIANSNVPLVVDFWAEWCGPCKMIAPILDQLAEAMGDKVVIAKLNVDEHPNTPSKLGIRGIPSLLLFNKGELVDSKVGVMSLNALTDWLSDHIK